MPRSSDILLVNLPLWGVEMPPIALAYLATWLLKNNRNVEIFDANIWMYRGPLKDRKEYWDISNQSVFAGNGQLDRSSSDLFADLVDQTVERLLAFDCPVIGFSLGSTCLMNYVNRLIEKLRQRNQRIRIIFGGAPLYYSQYVEFLPYPLIDAVVIGDGEIALLALLDSFLDGKTEKLARNCSVTQRDRSLIVRSKHPACLDLIEYPRYDLFPLKDYQKPYLMPIRSSRGCIHRCSFCADCLITAPYRTRNPQFVADEFAFLRHTYATAELHFVDLLINGDIRALERMCDLIIDGGRIVSWHAQIRARKEMTVGIFDKMRRSGCSSLAFGFETYSDDILTRMNKGHLAEDSRKNLQMAKEGGIKRRSINIMIGFPGESDDDVRKTVAFLENDEGLVEAINNISPCSIFPSTDLDRSYYRDGRNRRNRDNVGAIFDDLPEAERLSERYNLYLSVCRKLKIPIVNDSVSLPGPANEAERNRDREDFLDRLHQALFFSEQHERIEAIREDFRKFHPFDDEVLIEYANLLLSQDDECEVRQLFEDLLDRDPTQRDALFNLGVIELNAGNPDKAEGFFSRLSPIDRKIVPVDHWLGVLALSRGEFARACQHLTDALQEFPGKGETAYYLALAHLVIEPEKDHARSLLKRAILLHPLLKRDRQLEEKLLSDDLRASIEATMKQVR